MRAVIDTNILVRAQPVRFLQLLRQSLEAES
jgi:hypothetical protein